MGWDLPDDWGSYYSNCELCGSRVHASEGGCGCTDDKTECATCDTYFDDDEIVTVDGSSYCESCAEDFED